MKMELTDKIRIYNEDCLAAMKLMDDNAFDLAIVDPPYGIDINSSGRLGHYGGRGKNWDKKTPTVEYFNELERISVNRIIWGANYFNMPPTRCFLIWDKKQPQGVSFASCEYAWTSFDQSAKTFYKRPQNTDEQRIHPTQKPVKLYEWLLDNYAKEGDKILDTHLGSGSIAIACHNRGFDLTAYEIDKDYFEATSKRIQDHVSQLTLF
jgi:site-specific DNA-methyltransferase (adenine-specific)